MDRRTTLILAAGGLILFVTLGIRQSFGLFLNPMSLDLGWGREVFGLAIALQNLVWGIAQPFTGMIADKYGTARVLVVGGLLYGVGLLLMAMSGSPWQLHGSAGLLMGVSLSAVTFAVVLGAVGRAVAPERRSFALGIASAGGSLGQFVVVPGSQALIEGLGWSASLVVLALLAFLIVPLAAAFAGKLGSVGQDERQDSAGTLSDAIEEALAHPGYWYLNAGFFVCGFHVTFIMVHLPAYVTDAGLPAWLGGASLAMIGGGNIIGTYVCGVLGDRHRKKYLLSGLYLLRAAVIGAFILLPMSTTSVMMFSGAMGLLWLGTIPLTSGLVAQIFGPRYVATLFGIVFFTHQIGAFLGSWLGGLAYDLTGSYTQIWVAAIALGLLSAALHWPIADRPIRRLASAAAE